MENILNSIIRLVNDTLNSLPDFVKDTVFNVTGGAIDIKQGVGLLQETTLAADSACRGYSGRSGSVGAKASR